MGPNRDGQRLQDRGLARVQRESLRDGHRFAQGLRLGLVPEGSGRMRQDSSQTFHNTYFTAAYDWPDSQVGANMSYFLRTGRLSHELKVGGLYRFTNNWTRQIFEGNVVACNQNASWCPGRAEPAAELNRDSVVDINLYQYSGYISDTLTIPRLTVNLGLRYDYQYGVNNPLLVEGSRAADLVLPGTVLPPTLNAPAEDPGFRWKDWQPRVGATYSLGNDQKTLVRASYARYANQLFAGLIAPIASPPRCCWPPAPASSIPGTTRITTTTSTRASSTRPGSWHFSVSTRRTPPMSPARSTGSTRATERSRRMRSLWGSSARFCRRSLWQSVAPIAR